MSAATINVAAAVHLLPDRTVRHDKATWFMAISFDPCGVRRILLLPRFAAGGGAN